MREQISPIKLLACCLALMAGLLLTSAPAGLAAHSQHESYKALLDQVNRGEVRTASVSRAKSTVRVRLANRQRFVATFPSGEEPQILSTLRAHGVRVKVARGGATKSSSHIRYRFVALAILALGGLAALGYYLLRGRPAAEPDQAAVSDPPAGAADAGAGGAAGESPGEGRGPPQPPPGESKP
ncbi:MAG: hypothetical protein NVS2B6_08420 [Thermoleophilaceae bacterium]